MDPKRPDWEDDNDEVAPSVPASTSRSSLAAGLSAVVQSGQLQPSPAAVEEAIPEGNQFHTAILGPVGSGKTYLFQAMIHRLSDEGRQGVMTRYMATHGLAVWEKSVTSAALTAGRGIDYLRGRRVKLFEFNQKYRDWERLPPTRASEFNRYTVVLNYRRGWNGRDVGEIRVSFVDCAGELHEQGRSSGVLAKEAWTAYRDARVVVFCLPAWAAFPGALDALDKDPRGPEEARRIFAKLREDTLNKFAGIVGHYTELWQEAGRRTVRVVLALTQADSPLTGLQTLADRWVRSYVNDSEEHLARLAGVSGPTLYLTAARRISNYVEGEFAAAEDHRVHNIPKRLSFGGLKPWIIPLSAINGEVLDKRQPKPPHPPEPAHVELPVLLALCEAHNALM